MVETLRDEIAKQETKQLFRADVHDNRKEPEEETFSDSDDSES
ncbi:hypothetical protein OROMI_023082 [Orobanche minor]